MPIEIRELVIRATVDSSGSRNQAGSGSNEASSGDNHHNRHLKELELIKKMIKEKNER